MRCKQNLYERGESGSAHCDRDAVKGSKRCYQHRNGLPAWAQYAIDETFGPDTHVTTWQPGPGDMRRRYRLESADGSRDLSYYFPNRREFLDALRLLHSYVMHRERIDREHRVSIFNSSFTK